MLIRLLLFGRAETINLGISDIFFGDLWAGLSGLREEFAARSFLAWENDNNVWLSARAFSEKPKAGWNWAEGDDKNVGWREFPEFFSKLETGEILGDENGFVLILPSEANKKLLQEYKDKFKGKFNSHIK